MTIYLQFPDEYTAQQLAKEAGYIIVQPVLNEDKEQVSIKETLQAYTHTHSIDVVGVINKPTGNLIETEDGFTYPETAPVDGWHWNVLLHGEELPEIFDQYIITPSNPVRGFI